MPPKGKLNLRDSNRVLGGGGCRKMSNRLEWGPPIREGKGGWEDESFFLLDNRGAFRLGHDSESFQRRRVHNSLKFWMILQYKGVMEVMSELS